MPEDEHEFCARCDRLFASLGKAYLNKLALCLGWSMEDLQQEFRLLCWEIRLGQARFDAAKGDLPGYFIGRLQKKLHKNLFLSFAIPVDPDEEWEDRLPSIDLQAACPSALEQLLESQAQPQAQQAALSGEPFDRLKAGSMGRQGWIMRLWRQGLSQSQIARVGGVSQSFVSRHLNGRPAPRIQSRASSGPARGPDCGQDGPENPPGQGKLF